MAQPLLLEPRPQTGGVMGALVGGSEEISSLQ